MKAMPEQPFLDTDAADWSDQSKLLRQMGEPRRRRKPTTNSDPVTILLKLNHHKHVLSLSR